jgi:hypothetical protein
LDYGLQERRAVTDRDPRSVDPMSRTTVLQVWRLVAAFGLVH